MVRIPTKIYGRTYQQDKRQFTLQQHFWEKHKGPNLYEVERKQISLANINGAKVVGKKMVKRDNEITVKRPGFTLGNKGTEIPCFE